MKQLHRHMKNIVFILSIITPLIHYHNISALNVTPLFKTRPQGTDLMRQFAGTIEIMEYLICSDESWPGFVSVTGEYTASSHSRSISQSLFGPSLINNGCCQAIDIAGSNVTDRSSNALLADNFGLPADFQSIVNINPRVTNFIGDIQGYIRLDNWVCGLYFYIHAPLATTKWGLNVCEDIANPGATDYEQGYFGPGTIASSKLLHSFSSFISGQSVPTLTGTNLLGATFGETFNNLQYARWSVAPCGSLTKSGLADLRIWLGYDWINYERYSLAFGGVLAAPTGGHPEACFFFEPLLGNCGHWELGAFVKGNYVIWHDCDQDHTVNFFSQANFTHLFSATEKRTFDLKNKPLSRYMLAERLTANGSSPFLYGNPVPNDDSSGTLANAVFAQEFTPVANLTTFCVDVSTNIQIDWLAMLSYTHGSFSVDLGYELWYRGCERISTTCGCDKLIAENTWALKGDGYVFGFANATLGTIVQNTAIPLSATESEATIFSGTNAALSTPNRNPGVDNAQYALFSDSASAVTFEGVFNNSTDVEQTRTSIQPVFLSGSDVDICGAQTKGLTNKIFTHINYHWECHRCQPFLGGGIMGEFSSKPSSCNSTSTVNCSDNGDCKLVALSQWGVWCKVGFLF